MSFILETERLVLRHIDPTTDFEPWAACFGDPGVMAGLGGGPGLNRAQAWRNMASCMGHQTIRGYGFYSVIEKSSGHWVGRVGHWNPEGWPEPEVGWTIYKPYWRKGFATEAARVCLDYAFNELGWPRAVHTIAKDNVASIRTAERLGSALLYEIPNIPAISDDPHYVYGQSNPKLT
jgi:RimJ/RimL family protein N-acetyltransferase